MAHVSKADRCGAAGPRIVPLALFSSGAAIVALGIVWQHAQNYDSSRVAQGAMLAQQALQAHGLGWARVSERDGLVNIAGAAPSEAARVMAYHATRRALRPLMGREATINGIRSLVVLRASPEPLGRSAVTPPLDIAGLPPPPMPLVHEAIQHAAVDVPSPMTDESQRADEATTSGIETGAVTRTQDTTPDESGSAESSSEAAVSESPDVKIVTLEESAEAAAEAPVTPSQEQDVAALDANEGAVQAPAAEPEQQLQAATDAVQTATLEEPAQAAAAAPITPSKEQAVAALDANDGAVQAPAAEPEQQLQAAPAAVQTSALESEPAPQADACADAFAGALDGTTVNFARASAVIQKESRPLLDKLAAIAKRCKGYRLTVEGHTDLTGSRAANLSLSKKRAEAVRWALIDRGIDMDHIAAEGYGASRPLENATSDEANARNRRIAVTVSEASRSTKRAAQ